MLKNKSTGEVLLVVLFTLYLKEDVDENGNIKEGVVAGQPFKGIAKGVADDEEEDDEEDDEEDEDAEKKPNGIETSTDDID